MELNELTALKEGLDSGAIESILSYISDNDTNETAVEIRKQLMEEFGRDDMGPIFQKVRSRMGLSPARVERVVNRIIEKDGLTLEECNSLIEKLNGAISSVQSKKDALSS